MLNFQDIRHGLRGMVDKRAASRVDRDHIVEHGWIERSVPSTCRRHPLPVWRQGDSALALSRRLDTAPPARPKSAS